MEQEGCGDPGEKEDNEGQSFQIVRPLQSNYLKTA